VLDGDFVAALADHNRGVWRPAAHGAAVANRRCVGRAFAPKLRVTGTQRRTLRQLAAGRLRAAPRSLVADEAAPQTVAAWAKACALFPPATPTLATRATVQATFPDELSEAAAFGARRGAPPGVTQDGAAAVLRKASRGMAPGPSGLRVEHLWALDAAGRYALGGVLLLLTWPAAESRVAVCTSQALAVTELLLLRKPGGVQDDGLPRLRPIGMPEVLRKLAATALARAVREAAAALLAPLQLGVGVSSACERIFHEVRAYLAARRTHPFVQLDFRNAFNLVSRVPAAAVLSAAFRELAAYLQWVYGGASGGGAPRVYGWAVRGGGRRGAGEKGGGRVGRQLPAPPPPRIALLAVRGALQGDPLGPLLHAAALWLVLWRLHAEHPGLPARAFHDDVVVVSAPADLPRLLGDAARVGAAVDAELAPAKCVGWMPAGAAAPGEWAAGWTTEGVEQFSVPIGFSGFVSAAVDARVGDQRPLTDPIAAPPRTALQSQLLLLRLCAGPRA